MVIEIEDYRGDVLLYGSKISFGEFKKQIRTVEGLYDMKEENFVALLCRMYHWTVLDVMEEDMEPQYVYDRDIGQIRN